MTTETLPKLRTPEAAAFLGVSESFLNKLRLTGDGPAFIRLGRRCVVYDRADLDAWIAKRRCNSTSEYTPQ